MEIIVLCGIPASGKSTFCEKELEDNFEVISLDCLRDRGKELRAINECLTQGKSFVIDNTNIIKEDRERYIDIARKKHIPIACCFFKPNVKKSIERNIGRGSKGGRFVPEVVIYNMNNKFEIPSYDEGFNDIYLIEEEHAGYNAVRVKSTSYIENINKSQIDVVCKDSRLDDKEKSKKESDGYIYVLANRVNDSVFVGTRKDIESKEELLADIIKRNNGSNQLSEVIREIGKENLYIKHVEKFKGLDNCWKKVTIGKFLKKFGGKAMTSYQERYIELYEEKVEKSSDKMKESNDEVLKETHMLYVLANRVNSKVYVGSRKKYIKEDELLSDIFAKNSGKNALALAIKDIGQDNFYIKGVKYISCSKNDLVCEIGKTLIENGSDCLVKYQTSNIEEVLI